MPVSRAVLKIHVKPMIMDRISTYVCMHIGRIRISNVHVMHVLLLMYLCVLAACSVSSTYVIHRVLPVLPAVLYIHVKKKKRLLKSNTLDGRPSLRFTKTAHARANLRSVYNSNVYVNIFVTYRYPAFTMLSQ